MKSTAIRSLVLLSALLLIGVAIARDEPKGEGAAGMPDAVRTPEHTWLEQLVGEWTVKGEASMGPGADPIRMEGTESVRSLGGLWIVADGKGAVMGQEMRTLMTLGYDPAKKRFLGTWVDSVQTHMWIYDGELDEARKKLSLYAMGPSFDDPAKTSRYRDAFELVDPDTKVLTSAVEGPDGKFTEFMRAEYERVKSAEK